MKISELIAALQREAEAHGDVEVEVSMDITESAGLLCVVYDADFGVSFDAQQQRLSLHGEADY